MNARPKILLVKPIVPFPPNQGTRVLSFEIVRALHEAFDLTVLCRVVGPADEKAARELGKWCRVVAVVAPNRRSIAHRVAYRAAYLLRSLLFRRSLKSLYDCPGVFVKKARELAAEAYDLVIVEYWQLYPLLKVFPPERTVLLTHDIDMLVNRKAALLEKRLYPKIVLVRRWLIEQAEELVAYRRANAVMALTQLDADAVDHLTARPDATRVLPFGVEIAPHDARDEERSENEVLFMGTLRAPFNRDALHFFATSVAPHLDDDVRITVVGGELPDSLRWFGRDPRVNVTGHVDDVGVFLRRATCMVVPLRFGGGLRIRILEAMAAGIPVVCTRVAIAGMGFEPEEHFLLADEPEEIARQVGRLLHDRDLRAGMAARAGVRLRERYDATGQREHLRRLVHEMVNKAVSRPDGPPAGG